MAKRAKKSTTKTKVVKGKKTTKTVTRKRVPKGDASIAGSEAKELKTVGKKRSRKPTDDTKSEKKTRAKKDDSDKPLFNIFEVTLPDKTKVQRRFAVGKTINGTIMVKLAADKKWYVLLWASKGDKLEKRAEKIAGWHMDEKNPKFKKLLYTDVRVGRDNIQIVEKNTRGKVELVEDRTTLNKIRKPEKVESEKKPEKNVVKDGGTEKKSTASKKKKASKKASKKPVA